MGMKKYAGSYKHNVEGGNADLINLNSMNGEYKEHYQSYVPDVKNWSDKEEVDGAFKSKYANSHIPDMKNWSDKNEVRETFMKKYAGSYLHYPESNLTNLNSMEVRRNGGDYQQYYKNYAPEVKNWSDKEQVSDSFMKKFAGSYIDNAKSTSKTNEVERPDMSTQASSRFSEKVSEASSPSPAESTLSRATSKETSTRAAETALASNPGAQTTPCASLIIAATLAVAGAAMLRRTGKSLSQPLRDSLLGDHLPARLIEA